MLKMPFQGVNYKVDPYFLEDNFFAELYNTDVDIDGLTKRPGFKTFCPQPADDRIIRFLNYHYSGVGFYLMGFSPTKLYKFNGTEFEQVGEKTFEQTSHISCDTGFDNIFFTNNKAEKPKYWNVTMTDFDDIPGLTDIEPGNIELNSCHNLAVFKNFVVLAQTVEDNVYYPTRIRWSRYNDFTNWKNNPDGSGMAGYFDLLQEASPVVRMLPLKDYLVIYKPDCIYIMRFVGTPYIFVVEKIVEGIGLLDYNAICSFLDTHLFVGRDNIYIFTGSTIQPIGDLIIEKFYEELNYERVNEIFCYPDIVNKKVYIFYPTTSSDGCNKCLVYNYILKSWSIYEIPFGIDMIYTSKSFDVTWDSVGVGWDGMGRTWEEQQIGGGRYLILTTTGNKIINFDEKDVDDDVYTILVYNIKTKIFDFGLPHNIKRLLEIRILGKVKRGLKLLVNYGDEIPLLAYSREFEVPENGVIQCDISAKFFQIEFYEETNTDNYNKTFEISNLQLRWVERGLR